MWIEQNDSASMIYFSLIWITQYYHYNSRYVIQLCWFCIMKQFKTALHRLSLCENWCIMIKWYHSKILLQSFKTWSLLPSVTVIWDSEWCVNTVWPTSVKSVVWVSDPIMTVYMSRHFFFVCLFLSLSLVKMLNGMCSVNMIILHNLYVTS